MFRKKAKELPWYSHYFLSGREHAKKHEQRAKVPGGLRVFYLEILIDCGLLVGSAREETNTGPDDDSRAYLGRHSSSCLSRRLAAIPRFRLDATLAGLLG